MIHRQTDASASQWWRGDGEAYEEPPCESRPGDPCPPPPLLKYEPAGADGGREIFRPTLQDPAGFDTRVEDDTVISPGRYMAGHPMEGEISPLPETEDDRQDTWGVSDNLSGYGGGDVVREENIAADNWWRKNLAMQGAGGDVYSTWGQAS